MINVAYMYKSNPPGYDRNKISPWDQIQISLKSLILRRSYVEDYNITIYIHKDTSTKEIDDLESLSRPRCNVICKVLDKLDASDRVHIISSKVYAYEKACSEFERFIFLDNDTVVLCDIAELYNQDLLYHSIGGVLDYGAVMLDHTRPITYINAGILLVDSKAIKRDGIDFNKMYDMALNEPVEDQDALNKLVSIHQLHWSFNVTPHVLAYRGEGAISQAKILHFAGPKDFEGRGLLKRLQAFRSAMMENGYENVGKTVQNERKKIMLGRVNYGFGDWILLADFVQAINEQYPEIDVDIRTDPYGLGEVLRVCGCRFKNVYNPKQEDYPDGFINHVVYCLDGFIPGKHIYTSMVERVCNDIKILDPDKFKKLKLVRPQIESTFPVPSGDYVVVPSYFYPKKVSIEKDYPLDKYDRLVELIKQDGYKIYELNTINNLKTLKNTDNVLSTRVLQDTAKILRDAKFCVLIENGMNHWACHNGAKSFCIFKSKNHYPPESLFYPTMIPIKCYDNEDPEYVYSEIRKNL